MVREVGRHATRCTCDGHLRRVLEQFSRHYHGERNHQGIGNELIETRDLGSSGEIHCRECLGGLLKYYYRVA